MTGSSVVALSQYMTPRWAAEELISRFFGDLGPRDYVLEPTCGDGAFLAAIPKSVPAIGVEIDPALAKIARACSGREVIVGDFRTVPLDFQCSAIVGNPPFSRQFVEGLLDRALDLLPEEGRVGLILPCFVFQTASTVERMVQRWDIEQHLIPRNLYPRLQHPLCFAQLRKGPRRGLVGFALFHEVHAVSQLEKRYRQLLASGERSSWAAVTRAALEACGGTATLQELYREISGFRPTSNPWWQAKVRQTLRGLAHRVAAGMWRLNDDNQAAIAA
ncbi:DNA methyltransferase [Xanthomonas euvesicatoria]|uniref:class I SAM-dependent methyltransferase n=1 Tax=Xanthomonas euvesicatoria TaxID=456327 RepID=UPI00080E1042|nr:class I SAM-dependent methyltransferase [Xanthomonas euvesicatoria]OCG89387.1 DNA methyltransferase [Xanthomonas euvesicatoria]